MGDVEIEDFEITDWDIANEFNINRRGSSSEEEVRIPVKSAKKSGFSGRGGAGGVAHGLLGTQGDFGTWEKHTKGIGAKLLLQMGYQPGRGLGRDLQGISAPIEAKLRKGKGAIGLYGPERAGPKLIGVEDGASASTGAAARQAADLNQWRKRKQEGEKKVTYVYKTVDEVKSEGVYRKGPGLQSKLSKVKVIDMTGPEQRVLSGYHELHQQHSRPDDREEAPKQQARIGSGFSVPELTNNLELLVDLTERRIVHNDRETRHEEDRSVNLRHEVERLDDLVAQEREQEQRLQRVADIVKG
ncbi:tuftelin interacting protein, putative [Ixodes scapularis]|uniref:Tuftelin interacting protein, putative n=1 Tax=Ixodes scapularis TaxID=6945 RepID=B7Q964_IXOSC|nr:tuftelin interacting protein, putative [Ixodes scapularis]|eukprot:XP_002405638.1 tuftelin interacting protein, putative [Ixodes scapularis]